MKNASAAILLLVLFAGGCGGRSAMPASVANDPIMTVPIGSESADTFTGKTVGVRLTGEKGFTSTTYGFVIGYFNGFTSTTSQIVSARAGVQIIFKNVDPLFVKVPHTVSFLGKATATHAPWPSSFNGSATRSPAGTVISKVGFSTGPIYPGHVSLIYNTGVPGFYMVGCAFHYNSNHMRTVIIVM